MFFTTSHVFFRRTRKKRNKTMKNSFCNHKIRNICCRADVFAITLRSCPGITDFLRSAS